MSGTGGKVALVAGGLALLTAMVVGAIAIAGFLQTDARSCEDMERAAADAGPEVPRIEVIVSLTGNGPESTNEVRQFIASALASSEPDDVLVATVTLVNGDRVLPVEGDSARCLRSALLVAPSDADLQSFRVASDEAKGDLAEALDQQYGEQVDQVADAAAVAVAASQAPPTGSGGAFDIWPFVADSEAQVRALGAFTVGGDNCLTMEQPALQQESGETAIAERVAGCIASGDLALATSESIRLSPSSALNLTGTQAEAQRAVVDALCDYATSSGCDQRS